MSTSSLKERLARYGSVSSWKDDSATALASPFHPNWIDSRQILSWQEWPDSERELEPHYNINGHTNISYKDSYNIYFVLEGALRRQQPIVPQPNKKAWNKRIKFLFNLITLYTTKIVERKRHNEVSKVQVEVLRHQEMYVDVWVWMYVKYKLGEQEKINYNNNKNNM